MKRDVVQILVQHRIQPSAHRVAVAEYILGTDSHPSADQVWVHVRRRLPVISRATVYNTLNLFVERGLVKGLTLAEGRVVFDPNVEPHHHFIDDATGTIHDIPWEAVKVSRVDNIPGLDVREYQVIMRGRKSARR
jgi:Fur family iron response transcriptional regulator